MRVSKAQAAENRQQILTAAARLFRQRGVSATGVDAIAADAGLTHGAVYSQFGSKEVIAAAAIRLALERGSNLWQGIAQRKGPGRAFPAIVDQYLSHAHRDDAGRGCVIAALGSEVARQPATVRAALTAELKHTIEFLAALMPADEPPRRTPGDPPRHARGDSPRHAHNDSPGYARGDSPRDAHDDLPRYANGDSPRHAHDDLPRYAHGDSPRDAHDDLPRHANGDSPRRARGEHAPSLPDTAAKADSARDSVSTADSSRSNTSKADAARRYDDALMAFASMAGALILARAVSDDALSDRILKTAAKRIIDSRTGRIPPQSKPRPRRQRASRDRNPSQLS